MSKVLSNLLSDYGYNLVSLPKENINPLLLLMKAGNHVSSVGSLLQDLFQDDFVAVPSISRNNEVANIQGTADVIFDAQTGISMLDWLLQKLKLGKISGTLNIDASSKVKISYKNIREDEISLLELDSFISTTVPNTDHLNMIKQKLVNNELYVVNAVLKSNCFSFAVVDANGLQADISGSVKGIVNVDVNVKHDNNNTVTIESDNSTPFVFAFKAQRIMCDRGSWLQFFGNGKCTFHIKNQEGVTLKGEGDYPTDPLPINDELVDI